MKTARGTRPRSPGCGLRNNVLMAVLASGGVVVVTGYEGGLPSKPSNCAGWYFRVCALV